MTRLSIALFKYMVCQRCVLSVENILGKAEMHFDKVLFVEIHLRKELTKKQKEVLSTELEVVGFELIDGYIGSSYRKK